MIPDFVKSTLWQIAVIILHVVCLVAIMVLYATGTLKVADNVFYTLLVVMSLFFLGIYTTIGMMYDMYHLGVYNKKRLAMSQYQPTAKETKAPPILASVATPNPPAPQGEPKTQVETKPQSEQGEQGEPETQEPEPGTTGGAQPENPDLSTGEEEISGMQTVVMLGIQFVVTLIYTIALIGFIVLSSYGYVSVEGSAFFSYGFAPMVTLLTMPFLIFMYFTLYRSKIVKDGILAMKKVIKIRAAQAATKKAEEANVRKQKTE